MVVPLWVIGRLQQLLSCKEMEINQPGTLHRTLLEGCISATTQGNALPILEPCQWANSAMLNRLILRLLVRMWARVKNQPRT